MNKIYIGDDQNKNCEIPRPAKAPIKRADIKMVVDSLAVLANAEQRPHDVIIRVQEDAGTTMFLANSQEDRHYLKSLAHKIERKGNTTLYYIKVE